MKRARCSVLILNPSPDIFTPIRQMLPLALSEVAPATLAPVVRSMLIGATCSSNSSSVSRSEEHTSELQSLMRISYAVFCLKKKTGDSTKKPPTNPTTTREDSSSTSTCKVQQQDTDDRPQQPQYI